MNDKPINLQEMRELVRRFCIALTNVEAFSSDHALAKKNVDYAYDWLAQMLAQRKEPVVFSVAGKKLSLDDMVLENANTLVAKLAARLEQTHATYVAFAPELTRAEFHEFYRALGKGTRFINENGGLKALLEAANVTGVQIHHVSYVMLKEDEKVVDRDAKIVEPEDGEKSGTDADIVQYVTSHVLRRAGEQEWLLNELKNNPNRMAELLVEGINLAASRAEMGMNDEAAGIDGLLKNVQLIEQSLDAAQDGKGQEDFEKAIVVLENELRRRASKLMSSKVASGLINEILGLIGSYNTRVLARGLTDEFLKGEKSLKKAESLLRTHKPVNESVEQFLIRVREQLLQRGVTAEELVRLEKALSQKQAKQKAPRKPRKNAEEKLRETQQHLIQEERLQALGEMARGVVREFNDALAKIQGLDELLLTSPEKLSDPEKVKQYLQIIHTAAENAGNEVKRLHEFYRERRETEIFQTVDLNELVRESVATAEPKWKSQLELDEVPPIGGNAEELREVLESLISNAMEAMPEGGTITARTRIEGVQVVLEVSDTGPGMTKEVRRRCFEPFFSTKKEPGKGLGLAIVYGIVHRHGGEIDIESEVGKGTTVAIRLSVYASELAAPVKPETPAAPRLLRVLIVENDAVIRGIEAEYVARDGHTVETAGDGAEALKKLCSKPFDLVMTDRAMPQMNGDELAAAVKRLSPEMPVILVTDFGDISKFDGEKVEGVDLVVPKPFTKDALLQAVLKVTSAGAN